MTEQAAWFRSEVQKSWVRLKIVKTPTQLTHSKTKTGKEDAETDSKWLSNKKGNIVANTAASIG